MWVIGRVVFIFLMFIGIAVIGQAFGINMWITSVIAAVCGFIFGELDESW